jgi:hypothetical protein
LNKEALSVFNTIQALITTRYQRQTFNALIAAFLEADGNPRPEHAPIKSASAFSRFLNQYHWNARSIVQKIRTAIIAQLWAAYAYLKLILDLTTLEKTGAFPNLEIHQLKDKIGLYFLLIRQHLAGYSRFVVLCVVVGVHRFPWSFMIWRGKGSLSPSKLALRLLTRIPVWWSERFTVRVLADSGFDIDEFIDGVHNLGFHGVIGSRFDRVIGPGKQLSDLCCKESRVQFKACKTPVYASWFKRE